MPTYLIALNHVDETKPERVTIHRETLAPVENPFSAPTFALYIHDRYLFTVQQ